MNKKRIIRIISFLIISAFILFQANQVLATGVDGINPNASQVDSFSKAVDVTVGVFQVVTIGVGVIMLIVLAIKFMAGAPEGKADIKHHAVLYIVGAVLAFGASGIIGLIKQFITEAGSEI